MYDEDVLDACRKRTDEALRPFWKKLSDHLWRNKPLYTDMELVREDLYTQEALSKTVTYSIKGVSMSFKATRVPSELRMVVQIQADKFKRCSAFSGPDVARLRTDDEGLRFDLFIALCEKQFFIMVSIMEIKGVENVAYGLQTSSEPPFTSERPGVLITVQCTLSAPVSTVFSCILAVRSDDPSVLATVLFKERYLFLPTQSPAWNDHPRHFRKVKDLADFFQTEVNRGCNLMDAYDKSKEA